MAQYVPVPNQNHPDWPAGGNWNPPPPYLQVQEYQGNQVPPVKKRRGPVLWNYISHKGILVPALLAGLALIVAAYGFTAWLALQNAWCPPWAQGCQVKPTVAFLQPRLSQIQGVVSLVHGVGLAFLAMIATRLAEAAFWPTLARRAYPLEHIDTHLHAIRGSIPSIARAMLHARDQFAFATLTVITIVAVLSQLDRVLMGQAFAIQNSTLTYRSGYNSGGGIGLPIYQSKHNGHIPGPASYATSFYTSWSNNLAPEPLPELRDFIVDRYNLSSLGGDFTISGLKAEKTIACEARPLTILNEADSGTQINATASNAAASVMLRLQSRLSCWMDTREFPSSTKAIVTLIFAAINGTIEGGAMTQGTTSMIGNGYAKISSVACAVTVDLVQATQTVGIHPANGIANVSSAGNVLGPAKLDPLNIDGGALSEVAAWLGGFAAALGPSIDDAQPMFQAQGQPNDTMLPISYTTTETTVGPGVTNDWTLDTLGHFVNVTSGAVAIAIGRQWADQTTTVYTNIQVPSLIPTRAYLLLVPGVVMVILIIILVILDVCVHRITKTPRMRDMGLVEWTDSILNENLLGGVHAQGKNVPELNVSYHGMN